MSQHEKILNKLSDGNWHCSSELYALFIADPRTRICELKKLGYQLEDRRCQQHNFHEGGSKEWRLLSRGGVVAAHLAHNQDYAGAIPAPATNSQSQQVAATLVKNPIAREFLNRWLAPKEDLKIKTLF